MASSRVGANTMESGEQALGLRPSPITPRFSMVNIFTNAGSKKPNVLPEPVRATEMMSRPS